MKCWNQCGILARVEEININDLCIGRLHTSPRVDWVLNVDLPLDPRFKTTWDFGT